MSDPARESRDTPAASAFSRNPTPPARITLGTLERTGEVAPLRFSGRYDILGLIGSGGAGTVYRARDVELGEVVALKVLRREVINKPGVLDRFRDEVRLSRRITHRNVARMFDIGEHGGEKFLTMELIDGAPLSQLLGIGEQQRVLELSRAVAIAIEICAGLSAAHEVGIVHRDLKPDNVLLARDGRVVITDFGIARAVQRGAEIESGGLLGTPEYMAPEQVDGAPDIDARADLYALGVVLYEMLTGTLPFVGPNPLLTAGLRLMRPPPDPRKVRPELPARAAEIILRCMARERDERYPSALAVSSELATLLPRRTGGHAVIAPSTAELPVAARSREKTVAVLPFRNQSATEDAHLAEGLTEELIDALSMAQGVKVRSRGAVMGLHGDLRDSRALGQALGVQLIVEGALRRAGEQLRVTVRLVHVADGFQIWAQRFDRKVADFFSIADEVAQAITAALNAHRDEEPERPRLTDGQAIELFLRARQLYHRGDRDSLVLSSSLFEQALAARPNDPRILTGYTLLLARRWFFGGDLSEQLLTMAERALAAAPHSGEPQLAMATVHFHRGDLLAAARHLQLALRRSPTLVEAHELLGRLLIEVGPLAEGQRALAIALDIDPSLFRIEIELARSYALQGYFTQCEQILDRLCSDPATAGAVWPLRMRLIVWQRDPAKAAAALRDPRLKLDQFGRIAAQLLHAMASGQRLGVEPFLQQSPLASGGSWRARALLFQLCAEWRAYNGELEAALDDLARAVEVGLVDLMWLDGCPLLQPLRRSPRFAALRRTVHERATAVRALLSVT
ncbi:MAG: protein kinase [Polyangia bacterium]